MSSSRKLYTDDGTPNIGLLKIVSVVEIVSRKFLNAWLR